MTVGIDEVGRGAWAGPLLLCAVVNHGFDWQVCFERQAKGWSGELVLVADSKLISEKQRNRTYDWAVGIKQIEKIFQSVSVEQIESMGIKTAWQWGIEQLIGQIIFRWPASRIWVDGQWLPRVDRLSAWRAEYGLVVNARPNTSLRSSAVRHQLLVKPKADQTVWEVALASILAKVRRDRFMLKLDKEHPCYDWKHNKGYGTAYHKQAIIQHGLSQHHRASWIKFV